jgi:hypothetical protein
LNQPGNVTLHKTLFAVLLSIIFIHTVNAADSLAVERLISQQGKLQFGLNLSYANSEASNLQLGDTIPVQVSPGVFVNIPSSITQEQVNSDSLVLVPSLRYGITDQLDISWRASFTDTSIRSQTNNNLSADSYSRFGDSWLGLNYRFKARHDEINTAVYGEVALAENSASQGSDLSYGRSFLLGVSTFRIYDPIVVNALFAYQVNLSRDSAGQSLNPGDSLIISPGINFAPNRDTNLNLGFTWTRKQGNKLDGARAGMLTTSTLLNLGFAYAWSNKLSVYTSLAANISGAGSATIGMSLVYDFGKGEG